jgi:ABC-type multidrug transport system fused ATPase/permease subunit
MTEEEGKGSPSMETEINKEMLSDLSEVYRVLKQDAKDMLFDLLEGVSLWRSTARVMLFFSAVSLLIGIIAVWGVTTSTGWGAIFLGLLAIFLFGLAIATAFFGIRYRRKYRNLREKYSDLYESASKLG